MRNIWYYVAVILLVAWAIGFIVFSIGVLIHMLLFIAIVIILFRIILGRKII